LLAHHDYFFIYLFIYAFCFPLVCVAYFPFTLFGGVVLPTVSTVFFSLFYAFDIQ